MNHENLLLPDFWSCLIIFLALLVFILILIKCYGWLKNHIGSKVTTVATLIDKHENSAPIHQGGISSQSMTVSFSFIFETEDNGRIEFKVNSSMYAAHEIGEQGKIIVQGNRLIDFVR